MSNDSSNPGYLLPVMESAYDSTLDTYFQAVVVGITGLSGPMVRPRWQPKPPVQPAFDQDWCALGVTLSQADGFAYENFDAAANAGNGQETVEYDEEFTVLHSFYGPNAMRLVRRLRAGLQLSQNRAILRMVGIVVQEMGDTTRVPALLADVWLNRVDMPVIYRRRAQSLFNVLSVQSGRLGLDNEHWVTPIVV